MGILSKNDFKIWMAVAVGFVALATLSDSAWADPPASFDPELSIFKSSRASLSPEAKIFLLAGSSQTANFAQEILDQKRLWLARGFKEEEIACYYVPPNRREFVEDEDQFRGLAGELAGCYPASVRLLREHLVTASLSPSPKEFLYLFVTSHGQKPISLRLKNRDPEEKGYQELLKLARYPALDQYTLSVEGLPKGRAEEGEILQALESGMDPKEVLLTPAYLQEFLAGYFPRLPKFLVLQGCYSGGFLKDPRKEYRRGLLTHLDQVTVLTASRFDRPSFGCDPGEETTYFGGIFNEVLLEFPNRPLQMEWKRIFSTVREKVKQVEEQYDERIRHSEPNFYSNFKRPQD